MLLLDTLPSQTVFTQALVTSQHANDLAAPTYATLRALAPDAGLCFAPAHLYLVPAHTAAPVPAQAQDALRNLTTGAQQAAAASLCGSVLAGGGSEGDEFGDVAFWLGSGQDYEGSGKEENVLKTLGLGRWLDRGAKIVREPSAELASNLTSSPALDEVRRAVGALQKRFAFRVEGGGAGGQVLFFLVGRLPEGGWAGLLGIGVWSDA
ncbi:hypothetical protein AURDEDRAFT_179200 [Auricularia subglabra TFB-10046 SS5]|nr:hypothetical protein AURDEDRAFT_179200 [Auricularia subglabra TFB-10046 SS5]